MNKVAEKNVDKNSEGNSENKFLKVLSRSEILISILIILLFIGVSLKVPTFGSFDNIIAMLKYVTFLGILAIPVTFLLITNRFDLSIGATTAIAGVVMAIMIRDHNLSIILIILMLIVGLVISIAAGYLNGLLTTKLKINALIATLGTMYIFEGLFYVISGRYSVTGISEKISGFPDVVLHLPIGVYVLFIIGIIGGILLSLTRSGRTIFAIGKDADVSRLAGIPVDRIRYLLYFFSAFCCYLVALLTIVNFKSFPITTGGNWGFLVHAGCILGGCSIYGGKGSIHGSIIGIIFIITLQGALRALGISSNYQTVLVGVVLIVAVLGDTLRYKKLQGLKA